MGLLVAKENVASIDASAAVIEGVSRSRNVLLNADTKTYDWDSGYTCHQLGSGSIVVQLAQPYIIDSLRYVYDAFTLHIHTYIFIQVNTLQLQKCNRTHLKRKNREVSPISTISLHFLALR